MRLSIIIPAFNEAAYLPATLESVRAAIEQLYVDPDVEVRVEVIVVDNGSTDDTAAVARTRGARVVQEPVQGIARARNRGARHAAGDVLVFIDADVAVPPALLQAIHETMGESPCIGGGVDVDYRPRRLAIQLYLRAWRILGRLTGMVQGATQFCRRHAFEQVGGYDSSSRCSGAGEPSGRAGTRIRCGRRRSLRPASRACQSTPAIRRLSVVIDS